MTRIETAYHEYYGNLENELNKKGIKFENMRLFIRAFKKEKKLEVWGKNNTDAIFIKIKEYDFCASSGSLGPKRKEGDLQIPEGFYFIERFNPNSKFYLSLGLNYPNASDLILSDREKPGSDIFIHGGCASVGCIPIKDEKIKELYVLAMEAQKHGQQQIPVHVFPFQMTTFNLEQFSKEHPQHKVFWENLHSGFLYFEKNKKCPVFSVLGNGRYQFE